MLRTSGAEMTLLGGDSFTEGGGQLPPPPRYIVKKGTAVRYVDQDGAVHECLLDLKEVREQTGHGQATAIIQSVDQNGLDNKSIAFQSYDFTNSMSGKYNGAQAVVTEKYHTYHAKGIVQILSMNTLVKLVQ